MRQKVQKLVSGDPHFRREFKSQARLLLIFTLAFTIAFAWRQTVFDAIQVFVLAIFTVKTATGASILTSIAITLISTLLIYIASRFLRDKQEY